MKQSLMRFALAGCAAVVSVALAGPSLAQPAPLPRSGEFNLIYTFVNPEPWAPIPIAMDAAGAVTRSAFIGGNIAWLMNAAGPGFGHQMTGRCATLFRYEGTALVEAHGNCVYTDAQGDMLFEAYDRMPGETVFTGHWTGGTGKYTGITGTFTIAGTPGFAGRTEGAPVGPMPQTFAGAYELYGMSAGVKTGSYTLPPL